MARTTMGGLLSGFPTQLLVPLSWLNCVPTRGWMSSLVPCSTNQGDLSDRLHQSSKAGLTLKVGFRSSEVSTPVGASNDQDVIVQRWRLVGAIGTILVLGAVAALAALVIARFVPRRVQGPGDRHIATSCDVPTGGAGDRRRRDRILGDPMDTPFDPVPQHTCSKPATCRRCPSRCTSRWSASAWRSPCWCRSWTVVAAVRRSRGRRGRAAVEPRDAGAVRGRSGDRLVVLAEPVEFSGNAFGSTCLAVVVRPVLAFFAMWAVGLSGPLAQETLLLLAVPAGFFGVLLGIGYGVKPAVAGTTLLCRPSSRSSPFPFSLPCCRGSDERSALIAGEPSRALAHRSWTRT